MAASILPAFTPPPLKKCPQPLLQPRHRAVVAQIVLHRHQLPAPPLVSEPDRRYLRWRDLGGAESGAEAVRVRALIVSGVDDVGGAEGQAEPFFDLAQTAGKRGFLSSRR